MIKTASLVLQHSDKLWAGSRGGESEDNTLQNLLCIFLSQNQQFLELDGLGMKFKPIFALLPVILLLDSCAPVAEITATLTTSFISSATGTMTLTSTVTPQPPTSTPAPRLSPVSTLNGLPVFEINEFSVDHEYCVLPDVFLAASDAKGLNDDAIAKKLLELWLDYFNTPQAPDYCRVDGYVIDRVYYDESTMAHLQPHGDFMRMIRFSIKLVQYPNYWMPWPGDIDEQNWDHMGLYIAVFCSDEGYTMKLANP